MRATRRTATALALTLIGAAVAGCGLGPGEESDEEATLTVTRDYGVKRLLPVATERPTESETVMRLLDREAEIETRYGGGFVQSIEGLAGAQRGGRRLDWFYYVNGVESGRGAAEFRVRGGDRVWWDYRDWTAAMRVPAVVGSFPEPFLHGYDGNRWRTVPGCAGSDQTCDEAASRLRDVGVEPGPSRGPEYANELRLWVGPWKRLRRDAPVPSSLLAKQPQESGVFARFRDGGKQLALLDATGEVRRELGPGTGLVAVVRIKELPPVWIVTGTDEAGVRAAIELLDERDLRNHFAVATTGGAPIPVPVPES